MTQPDKKPSEGFWIFVLLCVGLIILLIAWSYAAGPRPCWGSQCDLPEPIQYPAP